jgi:GTPase Era involved in 16S rRNA processing
LIDARKGVDEENEAILERLAGAPQPKVLILNKIDLIERSRLLWSSSLGQRPASLRPTLHDLGADRRRRRGPAQGSSPP